MNEFSETFVNIFKYTWPMIFIFTTILASVRLTYIYIHDEKIVLYKELLNLFIVIYLLCLFYVVTFQDVSWSTSNFIPFKEIFRYDFGSTLFFKNVLGNMIMFMPFGFFASYYLKSEKAKVIMFLTILSSLTIEVVQYKIGRVFDIDDIILNILGGLLGFLLYKILHSIRIKLPKVLKNNVFPTIIVLGIIILFVLYFSGLFS